LLLTPASIPNLPFFYLMWRGWSNWRALGGSQHVEWLLNKGLIKTKTTSVLNNVYDHSKAEIILAVSDTPTAGNSEKKPATNPSTSTVERREKAGQALLSEILEPLLDTQKGELASLKSKLIKLQSSSSTPSPDTTTTPSPTPSPASSESTTNLKADISRLEQTISLGEAAFTSLNKRMQQPASTLTSHTTPSPDHSAGLESSTTPATPPILTPSSNITTSSLNHPSTTGAASSEADSGNHEMLLRRGDGKIIAFVLDVPEMEAEVERAVMQVEKALRADAESQPSKNFKGAREEKRE
jgi:hypothetical protein